LLVWGALVVNRGQDCLQDLLRLDIEKMLKMKVERTELVVGQDEK